ncbi:hypothetical protein PS15p_208820 [Mucor circinelloides]
MEPAEVRRLDVIHHIQALRQPNNQKELPDNHYIWSALNQDHYDFLYVLLTTRSYTIDINQFNIFSADGNRIERDVVNELAEEIEADIIRREDEEENRVLPQSSEGIADIFEDTTVQNLVEEFTVADHSAADTFQQRNNNNHGGNLRRFDDISFYVRQATFSRAAIEDNLRQYCLDFSADAQWAQNFLAVLASDTENPRMVNIHYAGITSRTLQQRLNEDSRISSSTRRSRIVNFNEITNPGWIIREIINIDVPLFDGNNIAQHVMNIGYLEDIFIKALGHFCLNKANGGFLVDWDPTAADQALAREFLSNSNGWGIARKQCIGNGHAQLLDPVRAHMRDYYTFTTKNLGNKPMDKEIKEDLLEDATNQSVNFGFVKSVLVFDDVPLASLREGMFHLHIWRKIGLLTGDIQSYEEQDPWLYRPYIDLFGFSKVLLLSVAIPFTSRYLAIVQPDIIISSSATVFGTFLRDSYCQYWKRDDLSTDAKVATFYGDTGTVSTLEDLEELSTENVYGLRTIACRNITRFTGEVYLANYSPFPIDVCLLFVERHPGALKYDPDFQPLYCKECFLTSLLLERLESIVQNYKKDMITESMNAEQKRAFFLEIKIAYETAVRNTAVYEELQAVKKSIVNLQISLMPQRGLTRSQRETRRERNTHIAQNANPPGHVANLQLANVLFVGNVKLASIRRQASRFVSQPRISLIFNGLPNSDERQKQLCQIVNDYRRVRENGFVTESSFPMPRTVPSVESEEYARWFLNGAKDADIIRSAAATGTNTYQHLSTEQKEHWLQIRGFGRYGVDPPEQLPSFPNAKNLYVLLVDLCDSLNYIDYRGRFAYIRLHCIHCGRSCAADRQTQHRCSEDFEILPREEDHFIQSRLVYPHDLVQEGLLNELDDEGQEKMEDHAITPLTCQLYIEENNFFGLAEPPIYNHNLVDTIFFQGNGTNLAHRNAMALDVYLKETCKFSQFEPPGADMNGIASDSWFFDAAKTKESVGEYFRIDAGNHDIKLYENFCCCGYYGIRLPCAGKYLVDGTPTKFFQQHKCFGAAGKTRQCEFGASAGRIHELPYPAARYTLYLYTTAPERYLNPFLWNATQMPPPRA